MTQLLLKRIQGVYDDAHVFGSRRAQPRLELAISLSQRNPAAKEEELHLLEI